MTMDHAVALLSQYGQDALIDGKDSPQSCLPPDSSTSCRLGAPGDLLARTVLCGHMPSFWSTFSPSPL